MHAQTPLTLPAAYGEAAPPSAIAGLRDARPISPLEFSRAWLLKVEAVRRRRAELSADGRLDGMTPAAAALSGAALTGTLRVPVLPVRYADVREPFPVGDLEARLFGTARADTMTYASYWREVSGGLLDVAGTITPWITLAKDAKHYLPRNKFGWGQFGRTGELRQEALRAADEILDFAQFDNDGPDGVPNSADDDGFVDFVAFVYALPCPGDARAGAIWPHRAAMPPYVTKDLNRRGSKILIADYVILPAIDPQTCGPMHVGVLAHETGHALGLPDLYDYDGSSQGIGAWGLMGTGSHNARHSPAHLSAWEKEQLGWVSVKWLKQSGVVTFAPVENNATVYRYDLPHRSGEYLLLENRQRIGSDKFLPGKGLLAWRIDPERGELGAWNTDERRGAVALLDADGRGDLKHGVRADASDPFPGASDQRFFAPADVPTFRLARIKEESRSVIADVAIGYDAPALIPDADAVRLTAFTGESTVKHTVRVQVDGLVGEWSAVTSAEWLRTTASPDGLQLVADTRKLGPGRYTETVELLAETGSVAGRLTVDLYVALPGLPEVMASDLPWSWGLAAHGSQLYQASYGWDALGLRPRPRVLQLRDGQVHPSTLARLPADALYAPVPTPDGKGVYVVARARGENYVYRVDVDGNASIVASRIGTSPAYGAALLPNGDLLVSEWNGMIWRIDASGRVEPHIKLNANLYQIATDAQGSVYAATYDANIIRWNSESAPTVFETGFEPGRLVSVAAAPGGAVYAAERGDGGRILRFDAYGNKRTVFRSPLARFYGLAVDAEFLYALDLHDRRLLRISIERSPLTAAVER
ncbi:MAG: M6 family metalloprotease domain-containing protein [Gemmatimonadota bacterium]